MEYVKVQITKDNIKYIKNISSFARTINTLIEMCKDNKKIQDELKIRVLQK